MIPHQPHQQPGSLLSAHPCNNTATATAAMTTAHYADYLSTLPRSSLPLPSSIFLPPPHTPPTTHSPPALYTSQHTPYQPAVDYTPSYSLTLHSPSHPALLKLTATSYLPLRAWLPWLEWDGSWVESHPMQTVARCPVGRVSDTVRVLSEKGVRQTRHMLMAKF